MKTMYYKIVLILLLLLMILLFCQNPTIVPPSTYDCDPIANTMNDSTLIKKLQQLLNRLYDLGTVGASLMVVNQSGTWTGAIGMADIPSNVLMKPGNLYRIGSISKLFTVAAALRLCMQKKLSLDDPIDQYLDKEIIKNIANVNIVTIRQLMNHTSKIPNYTDAKYTMECLNLSVKKETARQKLKRVYRKKGLDNYEYSNSNTLLLGIIISRIESKPAFTVIKEQVFQPLELKNTYVATEEPSGLVCAYSNFYGNGKIIDVSFYDRLGAGGKDNTDNGIISNVQDLITFFQSLSDGMFLDSTTWIEMQKTSGKHSPNNEIPGFIDFCLGISLLETKYGPALGHWGNIYGFNAMLVFFPNGNTYVAILINTFSEAVRLLFQAEIYDYFF